MQPPHVLPVDCELIQMKRLGSALAFLLHQDPSTESSSTRLKHLKSWVCLRRPEGEEVLICVGTSSHLWLAARVSTFKRQKPIETFQVKTVFNLTYLSFDPLEQGEQMLHCYQGSPATCGSLRWPLNICIISPLWPHTPQTHHNTGQYHTAASRGIMSGYGKHGLF